MDTPLPLGQLLPRNGRRLFLRRTQFAGESDGKRGVGHEFISKKEPGSKKEKVDWHRRIKGDRLLYSNKVACPPLFVFICPICPSKQLIGETREPIPAALGKPKRIDYEYRRCGTANIFMMCEPLSGRRHVKVTDRRTRVDFGHCIRDLVDVHYPDATKIVLVMDNLNTHSIGSLYETFAPAEARRLARKLEIHHIKSTDQTKTALP